MSRPLCCVLIPSGKQPTSAGPVIDFDAVYRDLIAPAIEQAGMEPMRAAAGGVIDTVAGEHLLLCEYAIVDLSLSSASLLYELGIRQTLRPSKTVVISATGIYMPFDTNALRTLSYGVTGEGIPLETDAARTVLVQHLREAGSATPGSSILELVENFSELGHTKTDVFRDRVCYSPVLKERLAQARGQGVEALRAVENDLGTLTDVEGGVVIDLLLSYRAVKAWQEMIVVVGKMSRPLASTVMVQEQLAFALNRAEQSEAAEQLLNELLTRRGPSSETCSLLGRIYKDRWEAALKRGEQLLAAEALDKAIDAYRRGFEADWRDAFPGINMVTLMELRDPRDPQQLKLLPVVRYAVERRISSGVPDYWDHATRIELAILARDEAEAQAALSEALACIREAWEPETTARNLRLIREARQKRGESLAWASRIEEELVRRSQQ
jgi:tetratricopeptide (TPR) repeat protein